MNDKQDMAEGAKRTISDLMDETSGLEYELEKSMMFLRVIREDTPALERDEFAASRYKAMEEWVQLAAAQANRLGRAVKFAHEIACELADVYDDEWFFKALANNDFFGGAE